MKLYKTVVRRLEMIGYMATDADVPSLHYLSAHARLYVRGACNIEQLPPELFMLAVDMAVGMFLQERKASGGLDHFDFEGAVSTIKEGDVQVTLAAGGTPEQQFDAMIAAMALPADSVIARYRKLRW